MFMLANIALTCIIYLSDASRANAYRYTLCCVNMLCFNYLLRPVRPRDSDRNTYSGSQNHRRGDILSYNRLSEAHVALAVFDLCQYLEDLKDRG